MSERVYAAKGYGFTLRVDAWHSFKRHRRVDNTAQVLQRWMDRLAKRKDCVSSSVRWTLDWGLSGRTGTLYCRATWVDASSNLSRETIDGLEQEVGRDFTIQPCPLVLPISLQSV